MSNYSIPQATNTVKLAAGWARVSTTGQADRELPLETQQAAIHAKASELGLTIPPQYDFAIAWGSESLSDCPDFQRLRELCSLGTISDIFTK